MRITKNIIIALAILITINSKADGPLKGILFGKVECAGEKVPFIHVYIDGTTIGTTTDENGTFQLVNLPNGSHIVKVQGIGYKSSEQEVYINNANKIEINFEVNEDVFLMDQVVVTSDRNEVNRNEAPVIVSIISPKTFDQKQSNSLIDGLDFTCGVRTECNCQNCGFTQVRMNGLDGPYSQILINSRPVFSGLAGVYGLELFPDNMIQRIEVVRGGGSALFGGNAIAGTINVITKDPVSNTFQIGGNLGLIGIGGHESSAIAVDRSLKFNGSVVSKNNKSGIFIFGFNRNRDPHDENNDGFTETVKLNNTSIGFNTYYKPGALSKISLDFYKLKESRRGGNKLDMLPHEADIAETLYHDITGGGLSFDSFTKSGDKISLYAAAQYVDRDSYYGSLQDETGYGKTYDFTYNLGIQYSNNIERLIFLPANLTFGGDFTNGNLEDEKLGVNGESNTIIANQRSSTTGLFVQNEWTSVKSKILIGFRFDHYNISDLSLEGEKPVSGNVFIPRITYLLDVNKDLQFRASYGKGYRAPQIFDEDLHIETSGARTITHSNDPNLKQETSHSFSTSLNYNLVKKNVLFEFLVESFYTMLRDPFANEYTPADSLGNINYVRINSDEGAYVAGINSEVNIATMKNLMIQLGFTYQKSRYEVAQSWGENEDNSTKSFLRTPDMYGFITLNTHITKSLDLSVTGVYTGPMLIPHFGGTITSQEELDQMLANDDIDSYNYAVSMNNSISNGDIIEGEELIKSISFFDLGFKLKYDIKLSDNYKIQFNTGIENIFNTSQPDHDRGVFRDPGYIYGPCKPRTIYLGIVLGSIF